MKSLLRSFLINLSALVATTTLLPGLSYSGGLRTLLSASLILMIINLMIVPLLKVMLLPLNILTFGLFTWVVNVIALYFLTVLVPQVSLQPYNFTGLNLNWLIIPPLILNTLQVAVVASLLIGFISHFLQWLVK